MAEEMMILQQEIVFDNGDSPEHTLVFVGCENRPGLLSDISSALKQMDISVKDAQIKTSGDKVMDVFTVVRKEGGQLPETAWSDVRAALTSVVGSDSTASDDEIYFQGSERQLALMMEELMDPLTHMVESVVAHHDGQQVVDTANYLMDGFAKLRTRQEPRLHAELMRAIQTIPSDTMTRVVRMMNTQSMLLNVVEEYAKYRVRLERHKRMEEGVEPTLWLGSFHEAFTQFKAAGVTADDLQATLNKLKYLPVFTAHPTEARRRVVNRALRRLYSQLDNLTDPRLSKIKRGRLLSQIECEVETLWRTDEMRAKQPTVMDEILNGLDLYKVSLFDATLDMFTGAEDSLAAVYGEEAAGVELPSMINFGSWIGGDRDGNPFVLPATTEAAALLQSRLVLAEYVVRIQDTASRLTHSSQLHAVDPAFMEYWEEQGVSSMAEHVRGLAGTDVGVTATEPYRVFLWVMLHRMEQSLRCVNKQLRCNQAILDHPKSNNVLVNLVYNIDDIPGLSPEEGAYTKCSEFIQDLRMLQAALRKEGSDRLANGVVRDLLRLAETFGFHLASLDIRQESGRHEEAVAELLGADFLGLTDKYQTLSNDEKLQLLTDVIATPPPEPATLKQWLPQLTPNTLQSVQVLQAVANVKGMVGDKAIGAYCISMAQSADDVFEVLFLGWLINRGLVLKTDDGWQSNMYVSPLFETIPDLEGMPAALDALLANATYRELVKNNNNTQEVMLGYSDSCKDGGVFASQFGLYEAQKVIMDKAAASGVEFRVFHGRGGSLGRGAGPAHESVMAQPPGSVTGQTKFTEQGEVITYRYQNRETAGFELACGVTGLLKASHPKIRPIQEDNKEYMEVARQLAQEGETAYRMLTDSTPGFYDYYYETTVVNQIALMNMGSRPARRQSGDRSKKSLRAIPWVFAWAQSRHTVPGWYGVGSALKSYTQNTPNKIQLLQRMHTEWPFFQGFVSAIQMSLSKADMPIALEYARLCKDPVTERLVYDLIKQEYDLTESQLLVTIQASQLLAHQELTLQNSLARREMYIQPLNYIQVVLLGRSRDEALTPDERNTAEQTLLRTIKALANAIRNTG